MFGIFFLIFLRFKACMVNIPLVQLLKLIITGKKVCMCLSNFIGIYLVEYETFITMLNKCDVQLVLIFSNFALAFLITETSVDLRPSSIDMMMTVA